MSNIRCSSRTGSAATSVHGPYAGREKPFKVAWRDGRQRSAYFASEEEARSFDALPKRAKAAWLEAGESTPVAPPPEVDDEAIEGVFAYTLADGSVRWRFNSGATSRRGFESAAAALKEKGRFEARNARGEVPIGRHRFREVWPNYLAAKKGRITRGSWENLERHGRLRLLPFFGDDQLARIDIERVNEFVGTFAEAVEDGEVAPKTINNCLSNLSAFFNWCLPQKSIPVVINPCNWVGQLADEPPEMTYFELADIPAYLECCSKIYRPWAEFLIGTGVRVSEAIATRVDDVDFDEGIVRIYRQRDRRRGEFRTRQTKGNRNRPVQLGPGLIETLRNMLAVRAEHGISDGGWLFLCPPPANGRYAGRTEPTPPHRKTVSDWHEAALKKFNERHRTLDVTLHGLRHTAAAAWLATKHPMFFVQLQLGHRNITTTQQRYGHLERSFMRGAAAETETRIELARQQTIKAGLIIP